MDARPMEMSTFLRETSTDTKASLRCSFYFHVFLDVYPRSMATSC